MPWPPEDPDMWAVEARFGGKQMSSIPFQAILNEMYNLADTYPDNVYEAPAVPAAAAVCRYSLGRNTHCPDCGCIAGIALKKHMLELYDKIREAEAGTGSCVYSNKSIRTLLTEECERRYYKPTDAEVDAMRKMKDIQHAQDRKNAWSVAAENGRARR